MTDPESQRGGRRLLRDATPPEDPATASCGPTYTSAEPSQTFVSFVSCLTGAADERELERGGGGGDDAGRWNAAQWDKSFSKRPTAVRAGLSGQFLMGCENTNRMEETREAGQESD